MESNELTSRENRVETFVFVTLNVVLAVVLAAALAAGGRDLTTASSRPGIDRVSNITVDQR